jgi:hypothetical protein
VEKTFFFSQPVLQYNMQNNIWFKRGTLTTAGKKISRSSSICFFLFCFNSPARHCLNVAEKSSILLHNSRCFNALLKFFSPLLSVNYLMLLLTVWLTRTLKPKGRLINNTSDPEHSTFGFVSYKVLNSSNKFSDLFSRTEMSRICSPLTIIYSKFSCMSIH